MFTEKMAGCPARDTVAEMPAEGTHQWYLSMAVVGDRRAESTPKPRLSISLGRVSGMFD